jgi:pyruvate dehydrogenase E1 component alpha subunit
MQKKDNIAVSFMGDGATNEGAFHEGINFAATWKLPVVYVCENNLYSATTSIRLTTLLENPAADRASAYGCPGYVVDGNDVLAVNEAMEKAIARARAGEGPTILELKTYRKYGHSRNDACGYRPKDEENAWFDRDPIKCFRQRILDEGVATEEEIVALEEAVDAEIDDSVEFAKKSPFPSLESAMEDIYAD